ncbi:MAG TPA: hypothetical protein VLJ78_02990 [Microvirga sp.]|nr:hypothetical protein [Microvirga sp.]
MRLLHRSGVCALALLAGAAILQVEPAIMRDLVLDTGHQRATVGAVRVPLWSAAWAQSPESFSLDNVSFTFGPATFQARRIELSGVISARAEVEALFSPVAATPFAERLSRINARQIRVPELTITQKIGPETQTIVYKNLVLADIVQGRIGLTSVDTTGIEIAEGQGGATLSYGRMTVSELDMPAFASIYETRAGDPSPPMTRIHGAFAIDDIGLVDRNGISLRIARLSGRDFLARPTRESWAGTMDLFGRMGAKDQLTKDEEAQFLTVMADFLTAFDVGFAEATGFELKDTSRGAAEAATGRIRRLAYTGATGTQPADARVEGFEVTDKDGSVRVEAMSLTGFSLRPTLEALRSANPEALRDLDPAAMRAFLPTLGTLRIAGADIDTLSKDEVAGTPQRVKATLKDFEFTADQPLNGVPTNIRIGFRNLAMALPGDSPEDGIKDLLALGYQSLDLSFLLAANWNEATGELNLREVSAEGQDMGSVLMSGILGNVSRDVFDPDTAAASVALIAARAKSLDLTVQNSGLFERFLAQTAREGKTTPEALRRTYGTAAAVAIPAMIGNSEQARTLSQAVARFIAKPGRLTISAQAKDPAGVGVVELMSLTEPADALAKLNVSATTE